MNIDVLLPIDRKSANGFIMKKKDKLKDMSIPLIVSDDFEALYDSITKDYGKQNKRPAYTKESIKVLLALGLENEMTRANTTCSSSYSAFSSSVR